PSASSDVILCCSHPRDLRSFPTRRSSDLVEVHVRVAQEQHAAGQDDRRHGIDAADGFAARNDGQNVPGLLPPVAAPPHQRGIDEDRKSTRLNSSHVKISYAVFCLKKKKKK